MTTRAAAPGSGTRREVSAIALGIVGSVCTVAGVLFPEYHIPSSPFSDPDELFGGFPYSWFRIAHLFLLSGTGLMIAAWSLMARSTSTARLRLASVLWALPLVAGPPVHSGDAYAYADLGRALAQGQDPYTTALGSIEGGFLTPERSWGGISAPYQPLSLVAFRVAFTVAGGHPMGTVYLLRGGAVLAVVALALLVPVVASRAGADPAQATWLVIANPLVLVTMIGGIHNDILMVAVALAALAAAQRGRVVLAGILVGLAMAVKITAAPALVAVAGVLVSRDPRWPSFLRRGVQVSLVTAATFVVVSVASGLGFGWLVTLGSTTGQLGTGPRVLVDELVGQRWGGVVALGLGAAACLVVAARLLPTSPVLAAAAFSAVSSCVILNFRVWYLVLPLVLVAVTPVPAVVVRACAALSAGLLVQLVVTDYDMPGLEPRQTVLFGLATGLVAATIAVVAARVLVPDRARPLVAVD